MSTATAAHDTAAFDAAPTGLPRAAIRPRRLLVGTGLSCAAVVVGFSTLIGAYLSARHAYLHSAEAAENPWFANSIPLSPGNIIMGTLLLSCVTMQWAIYAVKNNDRANAAFAYAMTLLFGAASLNATAFLYKESGIAVNSPNLSGLYFYVVSGAHAALLIAAMIYVVVMALRTIGGDFDRSDVEGVVAASVVWYVMTGVMAVVWLAIYVTK